MRFKVDKKPKTKPMPVLLYDDRERRPWLFLKQCGYKMQRTHLSVGDYTFVGYEKQVAVEKKSGLAELLGDLSASYRPTFKRFLDKLAAIPIKAIIVEDDLSNVAKVISVLQKKSNGKSRLTATTVYYWIAKITLEYRIPVIFTGRDISTQIHTIDHLLKGAWNQCI